VSAPVDVLAVMVRLCTHGGLTAPRRVIPEWNRPRATGLVANNAGLKTAAALAALRRAEKAGDVECVGTGAEHNRAFNKSAASERELYWRVTDAALSRAGGAS
jgi:hypothetical protein